MRFRHPRNWPIRLKLFTGYAVPMIGVLSISALVIFALMRDSLEESLNTELHNRTTNLLRLVEYSADMAIHNHLRAIAEKNLEISDYFHERALRGEISQEQAREQAAAILLAQSIGETGYLYALGRDGVLKVHPFLEGLDMSGEELAKVQTKRLHGYHEYNWKNPSDPDSLSKAIYFVYFEPWDWIISASSYRSEFSELINISEIRQSVLALNTGGHGYSFIVDREKNFIVHPFLSGNVDEVQDSDLATPIIDRILAEENGAFRYSWRNPGELRAHKKLVFFNEIESLGWTVATTTYLKQFYAPLRRLGRLFVLLSIGALLVVFLISWKMSQVLTAPVHRVIEAFERGAKGDLSARLEPVNDDEIGRMAGHFNHLMEQIEQRSIELKQQSEQRLLIANALGESERKYRELIESAGEAIFILHNGHFRLCNPKSSELFGRSNDELIGTLFYDLLHPNDWKMVSKSFNSALSAGNHAPEECTPRLLTPDGQTRWIHLHNAPIEWQGEPALLIFALDMTEQVQTRRGLAENEARYRTLYEHATDSIFLMDRGEIIDVNPRTEELFGYSADELIGLTPVALSPEKQPGGRLSADLAKHKLEQGYSGQDQQFSWLHQRKDGSIFDAEVTLSRVEFDHAHYLFATVRDVSVRVRAISALRESEQRFRTIFHTTPDAISILRLRDGLFVDINEGFTAISGIRREQIIGQRLHKLSGTLRMPQQRELTRDLLQQGKLRNREVLFELEGQATRSGLISANLFHLDGEPHLLSVTRDMEEIKLAKQERERLADQLVQAQKMESVGRLAGGVAHDFNNLLTAISGTVQVLKMRGQAEHISSDLDVIEDATVRAGELTRQLLTFGRRSRVRPSVIQLNDLLLNMQAMLDRIIGEEVNCITLPGPELPPIHADRGQVEQIVVNLAVNARDAMPAGGELVFQTEQLELSEEMAARHVGTSAGTWVRLRVSDNGIGMEREIIERIFEPFYTTKGEGEGTGLGLATVYGIVQQAGGVIQVDSEPGRGTTFNVLFPTAVGARKGAQQVILDGERGHRGSERLLIVENDKLVLETTQRALVEFGYEVFTASSAAEAIELHSQLPAPPQLVVSDVIMPGENGFQLAEKLRQADYSGPILFISGYFDHQRFGEALEKFGGNFFAKPFHSVDLARQIRRLLEQNAGPVARGAATA